jgi:DNA-binding IclR family transcriptional regulator
LIEAARAVGHLYIADIYEDGIATLAYPIRAAGRQDLVGVLTVSGPSFRFTERAADGVLPVMKRVANDLGRLPIGDMLAST